MPASRVAVALFTNYSCSQFVRVWVGADGVRIRRFGKPRFYPFALRVALDEGGRDRLRGIADACVAPQLRVALASVASHEDVECVQRAMDSLDDDGARSARRQ